MVVFYFQRLRSRLLDRLVFFAIAALAIVMVAQPEWSNAIAHWLGVGRGADLVTYLGISGLAFLWLGLYTRQRELDVRLTELARRFSILEANKPAKKKRKRSN
jgi:hypothetical protein